MNTWYVYILRCADNSLYTGITTDLQRRVEEHNGAGAGARYTRSRRPVALLYAEQVQDRAAASRREMQIKKMPRPVKQRLAMSATSLQDAD